MRITNQQLYRGEKLKIGLQLILRQNENLNNISAARGSVILKRFDSSEYNFSASLFHKNVKYSFLNHLDDRLPSTPEGHSDRNTSEDFVEFCRLQLSWIIRRMRKRGGVEAADRIDRRPRKENRGR